MIIFYYIPEALILNGLALIIKSTETTNLIKYLSLLFGGIILFGNGITDLNKESREQWIKFAEDAQKAYNLIAK